MKANWFKKISIRKKDEMKEKHRKSVEEAAVSVLSKYDKTFIDLARYDRGEKIFDTISH